MIYLLYNPLANNSKGEEDAKAWAADNGVAPVFTSLLDTPFVYLARKIKPLEEK